MLSFPPYRHLHLTGGVSALGTGQIPANCMDKGTLGKY